MEEPIGKRVKAIVVDKNGGQTLYTGKVTIVVNHLAVLTDLERLGPGPTRQLEDHVFNIKSPFVKLEVLD